ncbi:MAG: pyridoxal phosphate-dependent aminotransferase [Muribaculaceae bacterium]|nr:pyridoxal phosphate-dependent aminotransferase [Muribaculaceae bacterium]
MIQISDRVNNLAVSATLAMSQKSGELKAAGVDVINMSVGEPDFDTPDFIKEAAKKAIDDNYSRYTAVAGYMSLREAISEKLKKENGMDFTPAQIVVGNGAKQELTNAILATINPGDEVIIPVPAWVSYVEMVKLAEGKVVTIHAGVDQDFKITPAQLEAAVTDKTRMIMLNSPSNPTGSIYSYDELKGLAAVLEKYPDILILSDEIYEHINFVGKDAIHSLYEFEGVRDRVMIVNGVSKAYAMTGWRIGYIAAPLPIAKAISKLQGQYTSGASSIAQKAAEAAYLGPQQCVEDMRVAFERRRDLIVKLAREIPGWIVNEPQGAFYLFPEVSYYIGKKAGDKVIESSADYVMYLLEEAHVATVDGGAFCAPGYLRLSYATSDEKIEEAMRRIKAASLCLLGE